MNSESSFTGQTRFVAVAILLLFLHNSFLSSFFSFPHLRAHNLFSICLTRFLSSLFFGNPQRSWDPCTPALQTPDSPKLPFPSRLPWDPRPPFLIACGTSTLTYPREFPLYINFIKIQIYQQVAKELNRHTTPARECTLSEALKGTLQRCGKGDDQHNFLSRQTPT